VLVVIAALGGVEAKRELGPVDVSLPFDVAGSLRNDRAFTYVPPGGVVHRSFAHCGDSLDFAARRSIEVPRARASIRSHGAVMQSAGWRRVGDGYERKIGGVTVRAGFQLLDDTHYRLLFGASLGFLSRCRSF
jgi:hypothetical protein